MSQISYQVDSFSKDERASKKQQKMLPKQELAEAKEIIRQRETEGYTMVYIDGAAEYVAGLGSIGKPLLILSLCLPLGIGLCHHLAHMQAQLIEKGEMTLLHGGSWKKAWYHTISEAKEQGSPNMTSQVQRCALFHSRQW